MPTPATPTPPPALPVKSIPGLIFICAFCERLADQLAQGADRCHLVCGGPRKGMDFPLYKGPLTPTWLEGHCFVCGTDATKQFQVRDPLRLGATRRLGVCEAHVRFVLPAQNSGDASPGPSV
jgi:hypothetical protein